MCWSKKKFNRNAKNLDIQASPRALTLVKNLFATTCCMHATEFGQHLINHLPLDCNVCIHSVAFDLSSIHATSFKPLHPLSRIRTSSYSRRHGAALMPQHPEDVIRKKPKDPRDGITVRVRIEI